MARLSPLSLSMTPGFPLALNALLARARPTPAEAVSIVLELCRQIRPATTAAITPAVSRATVLLDANGTVATRGGAVTEDDQTVSLLGHLLLELVEDRPETSRLRRIAARATRSLPGGSRRALSVRRLASALRRNAPSDPKAAVAAFVRRASGAVVEPAAPALEEPRGMASVARGAARLLMPLWRRIA